MTPHTKPRISLDKGWFDRLITAPSSLLNRLQPRPDSADYQTWRHHFMLDRLRLCFWIAIPCFLTLSAHSLYVVTFELEELREDITKIYGDPLIADQFKNATIISCEIIAVLLVSCAILSKTAWARRYPALIFLCFSLSLTLTELIVGTFLGFPVNPSTFEFLAQAVLMPVYWQLHLLAQLAPILYYFIIFPILGLTHIGERSLYDSYAIRNVADLFWVCLICDLGVYLYERLKRSEFESRRQLKVFLHSVSHDLRTPVMGTSMVLQKLLKKPDAKISIDRLILERLLEGSDRQLTLINSLLEAHASEIQTPTLNRQPLQLSILVQSALFDLEPALNKNHITVINRVQPNLPLIYADTNQLWRVYCNLITNALKHNPHGINLILDAKLIDPHPPRSRHRRKSPFHPPIPSSPHPSIFSSLIRCTVQDTGIGIDPDQSDRLFDLYTRGSRARYMPGLGLGLYLCRQIIAAHGGEIGVNSRPGEGATFWFTLPVYEDSATLEPT